MVRSDNVQGKSEHRGGSGNVAEDPKRASEASEKGGRKSGGHFANDREKAAEAGAKGGKASHGGGSGDGSGGEDRRITRRRDGESPPPFPA